MRKLWLVAKREYLRRVKEKSFLFAALGLPLLMLVIGAISAAVAVGRTDDRPVGYVDRAGVLVAEVLPILGEEEQGFTELRAYPDELAARDALVDGEIQAYYVLPEDYLTSKAVTVYYSDRSPREGASGDFRDFVRRSLIAHQEPEVRDRLTTGLDLVIRSSTGQREVSDNNAFALLLPLFAAFFMFFSIPTAGGYLLQAVTEEKENRTMEIVATSVSPVQLMGGKALGLMGVSLTQNLVWIGALIVGVVIGAQFVAPLRGIRMPWEMVGLALLYYIPTFAVIAGVMTAIGAAVTELQQGQQISGIINMIFMIPIFFIAIILSNPNSPFMVALTLFPSTAFLTIMLRTALSSVPLWQLVVSWVVLIGTAAGSIWVASKVFRMGMLRYGQRLSLGQILGGLRNPRAVLQKETVDHA